METINIDKDCKLVLDTGANEIKININKCRVIISDISISNKIIEINEGELDYSYIKKSHKDTIVNITINKGEAIINVIDLLANSSDNNYVINLNDNSNVEFNVASIAKKNVTKNYLVKTFNNVCNTSAKIDCFGIVEDKSSIKYDLTSLIKKGAKKSIVDQNSKILLFDKESIGINNPILEIEENDVKANHGSSIGMIDEETLFYLTSRGIKENDARNLVSLGKINYIIEKIKDDKIKEELLKERV